MYVLRYTVGIWYTRFTVDLVLQVHYHATNISGIKTETDEDVIGQRQERPSPVLPVLVVRRVGVERLVDEHIRTPETQISISFYTTKFKQFFGWIADFSLGLAFPIKG